MNYEIEDTDIEEMDKLIEYYNGIRREEGFGSVWSMWTTDEWTDMKDVSGIPVGTVIRHCDAWGKITMATIEGETWLDVWKACNKAIVESGDTFHIFIENFVWTSIEQEDGTFKKYLDMICGS